MKIMNHIRTAGRLVVCATAFLSAQAMSVTLTDLNFSTAPGDVTQLELVFDSTPPEVSGYTIEKPARIALDLPGVDSALKTKRHAIGNGNARSATVVEAKDRSRLVINLNQLVGYTTTVQGNRLFVRIGESDTNEEFAGNQQVTATGQVVQSGSDVKVVNVDFRRGNQGEGQVQITLSDDSASANIRREGSKIIADIQGASLPEALSRRLDVTDFATPVKYVDASSAAGGASIVIEPISTDFEYLAYQTDTLIESNLSV